MESSSSKTLWTEICLVGQSSFELISGWWNIRRTQ